MAGERLAAPQRARVALVPRGASPLAQASPPVSTPRLNSSRPLLKESVSSRKGLCSANTYSPAARGPAGRGAGKRLSDKWQTRSCSAVRDGALADNCPQPVPAPPSLGRSSWRARCQRTGRGAQLRGAGAHTCRAVQPFQLCQVLLLPAGNVCGSAAERGGCSTRPSSDRRGRAGCSRGRADAGRRRDQAHVGLKPRRAGGCGAVLATAMVLPHFSCASAMHARAACNDAAHGAARPAARPPVLPWPLANSRAHSPPPSIPSANWSAQSAPAPARRQ